MESPSRRFVGAGLSVNRVKIGPLILNVVLLSPLPLHQVGFFDIVALPLFQSFAQAFTEATPMLDAVKDNYNMWRDETVASSRHSSKGDR